MRFCPYIVLLLYILLFRIVDVEAATYYVAPPGFDTNSGTSSSPFRSIQKCINVAVAGDTCTVADGTYTDTDGNGIVGYIRDTDGTAGNPITLKSTNPRGAVIIVPGIDALNAGFRVARSYWIIEGFDIQGGTSTGTKSSHAGISFTTGADGSVARNNVIHHIARTVCSTSVFGFVGVFIGAASNITVENNIIYAIGRKRVGENGCATSVAGDQNDHGIYIEAATSPTIRRNIIYDANRGWPIHVYKSGGTTTNLSIYHNTLVGHSPTGSPIGHVLLSIGVSTANIKNNISYDALGGMVNCYSLSASNVTVSFNLSDTLEKNGSTCTGVTFTSNLQRLSPGFVNAAGNDFHLNAGSEAIDAGTNVGFPFGGTAPDIGVYEFSEQFVSTLKPPINLRVH